MRSKILIALVLILGVAATAAGRKGKAQSPAEAWSVLPTTGNGCGNDLIFDYGVDGGMRNFFCRALTTYSWRTFVAAAPTIFRQGPHQAGKLNFNATNSFGYYDPTFVKWAADNLVPAATDTRLKAATQRTYDTQVRNLARVYFVVDKLFSSNPAWVKQAAKDYLETTKQGGPPSTYYELLGTGKNDWGGYDPNLTSSAATWWLRRHVDETAPLWRDGLRKLLSTYDATWLKKTDADAPLGALPTPENHDQPEYR
jgi:hypothetical protein